MICVLILGLGLLEAPDPGRSTQQTPPGPGPALQEGRGHADTTFVIPRLSWPPPSQGLGGLVPREPPPASSPTSSAPPVHCTMRIREANPEVDPDMARFNGRDVDPRMVVKSRCAN
jgi:hypothetical protein